MRRASLMALTLLPLCMAMAGASAKSPVPDEILDRIRQHVAERTGAAPDDLKVVRAEPREWPSGAMGCPQPGVHYTQSIVPGYWVVLRHEARDYDYRVARSGHFVLCEGVSLDDPPTR